MPRPAQAQILSAKTASEADIVVNKARLNYAEASRLAKSWLRGSASLGTRKQDDEAALAQEEEAEAKAERELLSNKDRYSETSGIGYHASDTAATRATSRAGGPDPGTAFLRKQLMNSRTTPRNGASSRQHTTSNTRAPLQRRGKLEVESDEEESRATVGKKKGNHNNRAAIDSVVAAMDQDTEVEIVADSSAKVPLTSIKANKKRGASSYLDELLTSRAAKKQKKSNAMSLPG
jgi:hypothetical protein